MLFFNVDYVKINQFPADFFMPVFCTIFVDTYSQMTVELDDQIFPTTVKSPGHDFGKYEKLLIFS